MKCFVIKIKLFTTFAKDRDREPFGLSEPRSNLKWKRMCSRGSEFLYAEGQIFV